MTTDPLTTPTHRKTPLDARITAAFAAADRVAEAHELFLRSDWPLGWPATAAPAKHDEWDVARFPVDGRPYLQVVVTCDGGTGVWGPRPGSLADGGPGAKPFDREREDGTREPLAAPPAERGVS